MDSHISNEDLFASAGRYGYLHPSYAEAFADSGEVRHLRRSGSFLLTRPIPGSGSRDALVGYPLLVSRDARGLPEDLRETAALADVVSITALTDPLASLDEELLRPAFPDLVRVEARHYVADLVSFWPARHHRRAVRDALSRVDVEVEDAPASFVTRWAAVTDSALPGAELGLTPDGFTRQMALPGCVAFTVVAEDGPVALAVVYVNGNDATLHAMASSGEGEALGARFALVQAIAEDMAGRGLQRLDLGAIEADPGFMDGWTEDVQPSYRCGRVVDRVAYDQLGAATGASDSPTFPAYRV